MNDETLIKCFEMEKRLKQLGSDDNEIADAKIAFVKGKSIAECELEALTKRNERLVNSFKESFVNGQMQIRHKYVINSRKILLLNIKMDNL